ncbi:MAG: hypothetical protein AAGA31_07970 [Bacteroidota bacterium]
MPRSLIVELLTTFSTSEGKAFQHFLARPERGVRPDVQKLSKLLLQGPALQAKLIHSKLYPEKKYDRQKINQLSSWLYLEAKAFLLEQQHHANELPLVLEFDRRKLSRHRDRLLRKLAKDISGTPGRRQLEMAMYATTHRKSRTGMTNLQAINDLVDREFIHQKLRQASLMQSHENVFRVGYDTGLLPQVITYVEERRLFEFPEIGIYYHSYRFLLDPTAELDFTAFQRLLPQLPAWLSGEEKRDLYLLGINFCIRQSNRGNLPMVREALRLYREGLTNGAFLENGHISAFTYRNAVALSLKIKDFSWAEDFIENYAKYLPWEQRDNLLHYNRARLAYSRGDAEKAMEELRFVSAADTLFTLTLDTLRAKIYFETGAYDLLSAHLDKMKIYLRRKGDSYHHRNYANFITLLSKTMHLPPGPKARQLVRKEIADTSVLTEREWLLEKIS